MFLSFLYCCLLNTFNFSLPHVRPNCVDEDAWIQKWPYVELGKHRYNNNRRPLYTTTTTSTTTTIIIITTTSITTILLLVLLLLLQLLLLLLLYITIVFSTVSEVLHCHGVLALRMPQT